MKLKTNRNAKASEIAERTRQRLLGTQRIAVTARTYDIAFRLLECYEIVWELENRWEIDGNDLLIAACAIEHKLPLVAHDHIFQKIELMFPEIFRLYTLLDDLHPKAVSKAESRLHLAKHISVP